MITIKIDFSEEVFVDTLLMPLFDNLQKCVGGLLFSEKKPDEKRFISIPDMLELVRDYKKLLNFAREERTAVTIARVTIHRIVLGEMVVAYRLNGDGYEDEIVSREQYIELFGD